MKFASVYRTNSLDWLVKLTFIQNTVKSVVRADRQRSNLAWDSSHVGSAETFAQESQRETAMKSVWEKERSVSKELELQKTVFTR